MYEEMILWEYVLLLLMIVKYFRDCLGLNRQEIMVTLQLVGVCSCSIYLHFLTVRNFYHRAGSVSHKYLHHCTWQFGAHIILQLDYSTNPFIIHHQTIIWTSLFIKKRFVEQSFRRYIELKTCQEVYFWHVWIFFPKIWSNQINQVKYRMIDGTISPLH